jgi:dual specificity protein kinase YAK1
MNPPFLRRDDIVALPRAGDVVVLDFISSGVFGQVFSVARLRDPSRAYAMKVTPRQRPVVAAQTLNEISFYRFAQAQFSEGALRAIGRMLDFCDSRPDFVFVLLERYEATVLDLLTARADAGVCLRIIQPAIRGLSRALCEMERLGIRHTDVKPENIMVDADGGFRLIDFGGARTKGVPIGSYVQTRWYRAPEVALGRSPTCAADVWSLGAVLAEMFIGRPVFAGGPKAEYLRLLEVRLGPFPAALISATAESVGFFIDGRVDGPERPTDESGFLDRPLRRLLAAVSYDGDPEEAKEQFMDLVMAMVRYEPHERLTAVEVCDHPFLQMEFPPPPPDG